MIDLFTSQFHWIFASKCQNNQVVVGGGDLMTESSYSVGAKLFQGCPCFRERDWTPYHSIKYSDHTNQQPTSLLWPSEKALGCLMGFIWTKSMWEWGHYEEENWAWFFLGGGGWGYIQPMEIGEVLVMENSNVSALIIIVIAYTPPKFRLGWYKAFPSTYSLPTTATGPFVKKNHTTTHCLKCMPVFERQNEIYLTWEETEALTFSGLSIYGWYQYLNVLVWPGSFW